ncbi:hypothetical protein JK358_38280 [Nocardia sp. 2]|uniref:Uncharacterized protein n=1 Tax=Nocardia acididurans TaxID=2802282 RepID=A0ABS1MJN9_9NOCA|nr:hypothetical protein [Nocardia acididurans]MBL1080260.1 hypothetical protein [Nocardia acididurans]
MSDSCPWCLDPHADDDTDTSLLCLTHAAEFEGLSVEQFERRDREEYEEFRAAIDG